MSAPIIIVTLSGSHLATPGAERAYCGESAARPMAVFAIEPGQDFGSGRFDCLRCAERKRGGL